MRDEQRSSEPKIARIASPETGLFEDPMRPAM